MQRRKEIKLKSERERQIKTERKRPCGSKIDSCRLVNEDNLKGKLTEIEK